MRKDKKKLDYWSKKSYEYYVSHFEKDTLIDALINYMQKIIEKNEKR